MPSASAPARALSTRASTEAEIHAEAETSEADGGSPSFNEWRCDFGKPFEGLPAAPRPLASSRQHDGEIGAV